jgi:ABC-type molybdenum transport system ATPase subunit/photorepair protein PhrA
VTWLEAGAAWTAGCNGAGRTGVLAALYAEHPPSDSAPHISHDIRAKNVRSIVDPGAPNASPAVFNLLARIS